MLESLAQGYIVVSRLVSLRREFTADIEGDKVLMRSRTWNGYAEVQDIQRPV